MDSQIGLIIQLTGIFLVAVLFVFLSNSLKSDALRYWRNAWLALSGALTCLFAAFAFQNSKSFFALCYLCEYVFVYLLIAGCRNYTSGAKISARHRLLLIPAILTAVLLIFPFSDFNEVFSFHSLIMAMGFAAAFFALKPTHQAGHDNFGWRVMRIALALLAIDFFHYAIIFSLRHISYPKLLGKYLAFNSIIDLAMEILLGFGMVIVLLERVRRDVEETNHKLKEALDKLEQLAHVDPLTTAFTRHAFYNFLQKHNKNTGTVPGCVGVFDIDNLKPINDRFGHVAGDVAISRTARAIRSLVRADDLIFRWGGDEFFVVMLGFDGERAANRMSELNELLTDLDFNGAASGSVKVSFGFADFSDIMNLEIAIEQADAEMYRAKERNKAAAKNVSAVPVQATIPETSATLH